MTKNIFSLSLAIGLLFGAISAQATEQEHLAQAIKQLDAAKLSLQRAAASAKVSAKSREYFDYAYYEGVCGTLLRRLSDMEGVCLICGKE